MSNEIESLPAICNDFHPC